MSLAILSHREIAARLGISHARVQQIERQALKKIRKRLVALGIGFDDLAPSPAHHAKEPRP